MLGKPYACGKLYRLVKPQRHRYLRLRRDCDKAVGLRSPSLGKSSFDPQLLNSMLSAARRSCGLTRYNTGAACAAKPQHVLRRNTVMDIAGLSSRHIRTCRKPPGFRRRSLRGGHSGGSRGGVRRPRERFVAIVESEEQLAEIAAMAGMASDDVGGRDRRETCTVRVDTSCWASCRLGCVR